MKSFSSLKKAVSLLCTALLVAGSFPTVVLNASTGDQVSDSIVRYAKADSNEIVVPAIKQNEITVPKITEKVYKAVPAETENLTGVITAGEKEIVYNYTAPKDGEYSFTLLKHTSMTDVNATFNISVLANHVYYSKQNCVDGEGVKAPLKKGNTYKVTISEGDGLGSFVFLVGIPKDEVDIVPYTKVEDSTEFNQQMNRYTFVAPREGQYRFELADVKKGVEFNMSLRTGPLTTLGDARGGNGKGCTTYVQKGQEFTVEISQRTGLGSYTLLVGQPKEVKDITEYTKVCDSIQFTDQLNEYTIKAPRTGKYRFEIRDVDGDSTHDKFYVKVRDYGTNVVRTSTSAGNGEGCSIKLEEGKTYKVEVRFGERLTSYSLFIGQPKARIDISSKTYVKDSMEYTDQVNEYLIKPTKSGSYRFQLEDIAEDGVAKEIDWKILKSNGDYVTGGFITESGGGKACKLEAGKTYVLELSQDNGLLSYTIVLGFTDKQIAPTAVPEEPTTAPVTTGIPDNKTTKQIKSFVERIYIYVLDRDPEADGSQYWTEELYKFELSGAEVAQGFIFSEEFVNRKTSDKLFVEILYKTFFDREPEGDGIKFWLDQLSSGTMDRFAVANGFIFSPEWADKCAEYGIRSGGGVPTKSIDPTELTFKFVERMYTTAMGRDYDEGGRDYWANELSNFRITGEQVGASFFLSDEMTGFNLDDKEFVNRLYKTFMDREADSDGAAYWIKVLGEGASRADVVFGFTRSPEFINKCIDARILPY